MIKELFDIEPVQKNVLIVLIGIFFVSFLQLFLFKNEILNESVFIIFGISMALTVCWSVLNILPLFFFFTYLSDGEQGNTILEKMVFNLGFLALAWFILLTYISYELNLSYNVLVKILVFSSILRTIFWFVVVIIKSNKKQ